MSTCELEVDRITEGLAVVRYDWMMQRIDVLRLRYGPEAEIVLVADHPYDRTEWKAATTEKRYRKDVTAMVRAGAGGPELIGNRATSTSKSNKFSRDRANRRKRAYEEGVDYASIARTSRLALPASLSVFAQAIQPDRHDSRVSQRGYRVKLRSGSLRCCCQRKRT